MLPSAPQLRAEAIDRGPQGLRELLYIHILSPCYVPGFALGAWHTSVNKTDTGPCLCEASILWGNLITIGYCMLII